MGAKILNELPLAVRMSDKALALIKVYLIFMPNIASYKQLYS